MSMFPEFQLQVWPRRNVERLACCCHWSGTYCTTTIFTFLAYQDGWCLAGRTEVSKVDIQAGNTSSEKKSPGVEKIVKYHFWMLLISCCESYLESVEDLWLNKKRPWKKQNEVLTVYQLKRLSLNVFVTLVFNNIITDYYLTLCTFICPGVVRCILYKVSPLMDLSQTWISRENINHAQLRMIYSQLPLH